MTTAFKNITHIKYEGPGSKNPLSFKHYHAEEIVEGKTMREHLRFAVVYWHTFRGTGSDPFGPGTIPAAFLRLRSARHSGFQGSPHTPVVLLRFSLEPHTSQQGASAGGATSGSSALRASRISRFRRLRALLHGGLSLPSQRPDSLLSFSSLPQISLTM